MRLFRKQSGQRGKFIGPLLIALVGVIELAFGVFESKVVFLIVGVGLVMLAIAKAYEK